MGKGISDVPVARRWLLQSGFASAALVLAPEMAAMAADSAGSVDDVRGEAHAESAGTKRALARRSDVFVGDLVDTGATALLVMRLGASTTLKLGPLSKLKIEKYLADVGGTLELVDGVMQFERKGPPLKAQLDFRSPYGLIAVRGTRFYAGMSRGRFGVLVGQGKVEVTAGGKTVLVGAQQGTDIARPGDPPSPPQSWPRSRIRELQKGLR